MKNPGRILILGATSAIAQAYARRRATTGAAFVLAGRNGERLKDIAADLVARGAAKADLIDMDLAAIDKIDGAAADLRSRFGEPDEVVIAYGVLGKPTHDDQQVAAARTTIDVNFTSPALWVLALLKGRPRETAFTLVVIGSVAGDRGRASNFIYGSAKGGLERFLEGLSQEYAGSGVHILTVKPGFVDTPMTDGVNKQGPLWATPDKIASDIERAVAGRKRVIYTPWFWWPIMLIIRALPWFVFKRLKI